MEAEGVHNYHCQDAPKDSLFSHHQMKSGIENYRLPRNHAIPPDRHNCHAKIEVRGQSEKLQDKTERVEDTAITADQEGPEVEAPMPFEGQKDLNVQFYHVVPGDSSERSNGHPCCSVKFERNGGDAMPRGTVFGCAIC